MTSIEAKHTEAFQQQTKVVFSDWNRGACKHIRSNRKWCAKQCYPDSEYCRYHYRQRLFAGLLEDAWIIYEKNNQGCASGPGLRFGPHQTIWTTQQTKQGYHSNYTSWQLIVNLDLSS